MIPRGKRGDAVVELRGLDTDFLTDAGSVHAVDGLSLVLRRGAITGLVGESGSGKSTVALSIIRLLGRNGRISAGEICFAGTDLRTLPEPELRRLRGHQIGVVFQDPLTCLTPSLRIGEQLEETILAHLPLSRAEARERSVDLLIQVGIPDAERRSQQFPHQFSGGMRQRVAIALALCCDPEVLILDEPTTALDVTTQAQILELLERLRQERSLAMLFITHDLGVVTRMCDDVCVMYAGRVVEHALLETLFSSPKHPYTKGLLASVLRLSDPVRGDTLPSISGRVPSLADPPAGCIFESRCPFAEARCAEPQALEEAGGSRVACWKHTRLEGTPWPSERGTSARIRPSEAMPVMEVAELRKDFALTGMLDSVRFERNGGLVPRPVYRPRLLRAVDDVSITLARGETLGLVGESGCGKTTLGRALAGLVDLTEGEVQLNGRSREGMAKAELQSYRKDVQIIFQNPDSSLNPRQTVAQIIGRPLELFRIARGHRPQRVEELLASVHLPADYAKRYPHQLSGGEKQRVGIARALAAEPRVIVCDEPTSALDVSVRATILNLLVALQDELGLAYLFIAHDLAAVRHIADRIAVMYRGRIVEHGTTEEIFSPPHHPYTAALLSAIPSVDLAERGKARIKLRGSVAGREPDGTGCPFADRCPWKLGSVCESERPPDRQVAPGHSIHCHHDVAYLQTLESDTANMMVERG